MEEFLDRLNYRNKHDWLTIIPLLFLVLCIGCGIGRLLHSIDSITIFSIISTINENIFATFISMVICMAYQFFSARGSRKEERSGLSRKYIPLTIIASAVYGIMFVVDACLYNKATIILLFVVSVGYMVLYFSCMRR